MNRSSQRVVLNSSTYAVLTLAAVILTFPFIWMFFASFKSGLEVVNFPPKLLPETFSFENYTDIRNYFPIYRFLFNSIFVSVVTSVLQLLVCSMAAFVFAKISFKIREYIFILYLITIMIPVQVTIIPLYIIIQRLGLVDTYLSIILPSIFSVFGTFLLRQHINKIADSFLESAFMDGASYFQVFFQIVLPLIKPALATLGILSFMYAWNNFLWPLIVLNSKELMTLPVGLSKLQGRWSTVWNVLMAGNVIAFLPMLSVYLLAQKYFIKGLTMGGIKE